MSMPDRLGLYSRNKLKLGLFGANCSSGRAVTKVPERWSGSWDDCLRLARLADEAGIEFLHSGNVQGPTQVPVSV